METRGTRAGFDLGKSIIEMVNLMYQNNTAAHFYKGLFKVISEETQKRNIAPDAADNEGRCNFCEGTKEIPTPDGPVVCPHCR